MKRANGGMDICVMKMRGDFMARFFSFCVVLLLSVCSHATYLEIEDDEDVDRVYNTVHHFWRDYPQQRECFERSLLNDDLLLENAESKMNLHQIRRSTHDLVKLAKRYSSEFLSDLNSDIKYIKENKDVLSDQNIAYEVFYKELVLLKLVFLLLVQK